LRATALGRKLPWATKPALKKTVSCNSTMISHALIIVSPRCYAQRVFVQEKLNKSPKEKTRFPFECNDFVTSDQMPSPHMNNFSFAKKQLVFGVWVKMI
jgi:hypothetical protein